MKTRLRLVAALIASLSWGVEAADIEMFVLGKSREHEQSGTGAPSEQGYGAFAFLDAASETSANAVSLTVPGGEVVNFQQWGTEWELPEDDLWFETKSELDAEVPNGTYQLRVETQNQGTVNESLALTGDLYPPTPRIQNYEALQSINPNQSLELSWDAWTGANTNTIIRIEVEHADEVVFETMDLTGSDTGISLPADIFDAGKMYQLTIMFLNAADTFTVGGGDGPTGMALYIAATKLTIRTEGEVQPQFFLSVNSGCSAQSMSPVVGGKTVGQPDCDGNFWYGLDVEVSNQEEYAAYGDVQFSGPEGSGISEQSMEGGWEDEDAVGYWSGLPFGTTPPSGEWTIHYDGTDYTTNLDLSGLENDRRIVLPEIEIDENGNISRIDWTYRDADSNEDIGAPQSAEEINVRLVTENWTPLWEWEGNVSQTGVDLAAMGEDVSWRDVDDLSLRYETADDRFAFYSTYQPNHFSYVDIAVTNLAASPSEVAVGHPVSLTANVENRGSETKENIDIRFENQGTLIALETISLNAGESAEVTIEWTPTEPGTHEELTATVVDESDMEPSNDRAQADPVTVIPPPAPLDELIAQIGIFSGIDYGEAGVTNDTEYVFSMEIEERGQTIQSLTLDPPGTAPVLEMSRSDESTETTLPGGEVFLIDVWYDQNEDRTQWEIEIVSKNEAIDALFGSGTYTLTAQFLDGSTKETTVWFGEYTQEGTPQPQTDLPKPTDEPMLTSPENHQRLTPRQIAVSWPAVTDPNVRAVHAYAEYLFADTELLDVFHPDSDSHSETVQLDEDGLVEIGLAHAASFGFEQAIRNSDGIRVMGARYAETRHRLLIAADPRLPLQTGWNLLGIFVDSEQTMMEFLDDSPTASVAAVAFSWNKSTPPLGSYAAIGASDPAEPGAGCWIRRDSPSFTRELTGQLSSNRADVSAGWNLIAPSQPGTPPKHPEIALPIWSWSAENQAYHRVDDQELMVPGLAYWMFARSPIEDLRLTED